MVQNSYLDAIPQSDEKGIPPYSENIIASIVIPVAEGEMNLTGEQFLQWYQEKYLPS